eukprot:scaffold2803_cov347-Prasinococcus_capsulatus_cf.AAC.6
MQSGPVPFDNSAPGSSSVRGKRGERLRLVPTAAPSSSRSSGVARSHSSTGTIGMMSLCRRTQRACSAASLGSECGRDRRQRADTRPRASCDHRPHPRRHVGPLPSAEPEPPPTKLGHARGLRG